MNGIASAPSPAPVDSRHPAADALAARLRERLSDASRVFVDERMASRTTLRVGGNADVLVEPADEGDLANTLETARALGVPWRVVGRGSNLLISDRGIRGAVIVLKSPGFARLRCDPPHLDCGAGVRLKDLAAEAKRRGLAGLEFLAGIPGSVGGALRMNAGAWNTATFERVERIRHMAPDGTITESAADRIPVEYRHCALFREHLVLSAVFRGEPSSVAEVEERMNELNRRRWATQPAASSAGCIFKNPLTIPAGRLIDELGLKGIRVGGAQVSTVHGNFIVNEGGATAADVRRLIELIQGRAWEMRGIRLETEVEILGDA